MDAVELQKQQALAIAQAQAAARAKANAGLPAGAAPMQGPPASAATVSPDIAAAADAYQKVRGNGAFAAATDAGASGIPFSDELYSALSALPNAAISAVEGKGFHPVDEYNRSQAIQAELQRRNQEQHPVASTLGAIAGGIGATAPVSAAGYSLLNGAKATLPSLMGRGAVEGAAYGGLYGAGEGNGLEDRLWNAAKGAGFGAATGGALGAVGRIGARGAVPAAPTADDVAAQSRALYDASEAQGVTFKPQAVQRLSANLKLAAGRLNDRLRPMTAGFMDDIDAMSNGQMSLEAFDEFRKSLNQSIQKAMPDDARTLNAMKKMADGFADNISPTEITGGIQGIDLLNQARQLWARSKKAETIERIMDLADVQTGQYTQSGMANTITREMRGLYKQIAKGKAAQAWTPEETALIRQMAKGGSSSQIVNLFSKFAPRGVVSITAGQALGSALPGVGNVAVPLLGHAAGNAADRAAIQAAQTLRAGAATGTLPQVPLLSDARRKAIEALIRGSAPTLPAYTSR